MKLYTLVKGTSLRYFSTQYYAEKRADRALDLLREFQERATKAKNFGDQESLVALIDEYHKKSKNRDLTNSIKNSLTGLVGSVEWAFVASTSAYIFHVAYE